MTKPDHGRIKNWTIVPRGNSYCIRGEFLDHPLFRSVGHTSVITRLDLEANTVETKNSRYTLVSEGEPSRLGDFPMKGDLMRFLGENGYPHELREAMTVFFVGQELEVEDCDVGHWNHTVKFVRYPGRWNGVMFARVQ